MTDSRRALVASAPTRLDFGGGWTDVPPFPEERGGFVCNVAINRRATVQVTPALSNAILPPDGLIRAALRKACVENVAVHLESDFPIGAGLGGSSAAGVALAAALHRWRGELADAATLAEWSRAVEVEELGIAGGRQDHYAAAFGGALGLSFDVATHVQSLALSPAARIALERQCLLVYTGESRISATTITAVLDAYLARDARVVDALDAMKSLAQQMSAALPSGDIELLAQLVDTHWTHQQALHPAITTPRIDAIYAAATNAGSLGMKALGASGGGCVIVFAPDGRVEAVTRAIAPLGGNPAVASR
ncbi:MAG: hypothetical protein IPP90_01740 [Gemmatimonadaceae bacterium]|nr:hypothetical protein [Gemmatimonadaceae bacterium]